MCVHIHIYIYIYIDRSFSIYIYIYIYAYICMHTLCLSIYTSIYCLHNLRYTTLYNCERDASHI